MSTRRRRTPLGTRPPSAVTSALRTEIAGTLWAETEPFVKQEPSTEERVETLAGHEQTVVIQIDDEWLAWLEGLDRSAD